MRGAQEAVWYPDFSDRQTGHPALFVPRGSSMAGAQSSASCFTCSVPRGAWRFLRTETLPLVGTEKCGVLSREGWAPGGRQAVRCAPGCAGPRARACERMQAPPRPPLKEGVFLFSRDTQVN